MQKWQRRLGKRNGAEIIVEGRNRGVEKKAVSNRGLIVTEEGWQRNQRKEWVRREGKAV